MKLTRLLAPLAMEIFIGSAAALVLFGSAAVGVQAQHMMAMPAVTVEAPVQGATITGETIDVSVQPSNFLLECDNVGKPGLPTNQGHIHAMVDGMDMAHLINAYCSNHFSLSTKGLKPGKHLLTVVLADDAHTMASAPAMVPFVYQPASASSLPAQSPAKATLAILSPRNGSSVARKFDLTLGLQGFNLSCALEGRPNVAGYGHVHVFATQAGVTDKEATAPLVAMMGTDTGKALFERLVHETGMSPADLKSLASMSEVGLLGMPCTTKIPVDLSTWHGGPVKVLVMLANDDHMPTAGVPPAAITLNLK